MADKFKKKGNIFIFISIACVLVLVAVWFVSNRWANYQATSYSQLDRAIEMLNKADNEDNGEELVALLAGLRQNRVGYVRQKAHFLSGEMSRDAGNISEAIDYFKTLRTRYSNSYLAMVAGLNEAYLLEQNNQLDESLSVFKQIGAKQSLFSPWQEALINAGRLSETLNREDAIEIYRQLIAKIEGDNFWKTLAQNRLLTLGVALQG
jgi:tetratricopeptide (TPR) repeat protein